MLIKQLTDKLTCMGYMPIVRINGSINAVTIQSPYAQHLHSLFRNRGLRVTFYNYEDMIAIHDSPQKVFKVLDALQ